MNWEHLCPGCMHELTEEEIEKKICPHCNYNQNEEKPEGALPILTILSGKYLIGKVLETDSTSFTYLAYDLNLEVKIQITEYFPNALVKRDTDMRSVVPVSAETENAYEMGQKNHLENTRQIVKMVTRSGGENIIRDCFEENNTVYTALVDIMAPTVTTMPSMEEVKKSQESKTTKKKKIFLTAGIVLAVLSVIAVIFGVINYQNNFKTNENWAAVYKASMLGTLYDDEIMVLATENSLYYSEFDENGNLPELYWLANLNINETIYCVDSDDEYLYVSVTNNGIFRADIESKQVEYKQIVSRDALEFVLYDKYIYYAEGDTLYRAKKDGTNEMVMAENASLVFTVYKNSIFYYSNTDGCIYRVNENGKDAAKVTEMSGVTKLLAAKANLWAVKDGSLYRMDIGSGEIAEKEAIDSVGSNSDIYVSDNVVFYLSSDNKKVNAYDVSTKEIKVLYSGTEILMTGMMKDNLYIVNGQGEYYSLNIKGSSKKKMDFNYLSMSQDCLYD